MARKKNNNTIETRDLALVAYLQVNGINWNDVVVEKELVTFIYDADEKVKEKMNDYFKDDGKFLSFASRMKDLKTFIRQLIK